MAIGLLALQPVMCSDRISTITEDDSTSEDENREDDDPLFVEGQDVDQLSALNCGNSDFEATVTEACESVEPEPVEQVIRMKVFQRVNMVKRPAVRCTARVTSLFTGCGMWSHSYLSKTHKIDRVFEMSEDSCYYGFINGAFVIGDKVYAIRQGMNIIEDIPTGTVVNKNGETSCEGGTVVSGRQTFTNVVEQREIRITIKRVDLLLNEKGILTDQSRAMEIKGCVGTAVSCTTQDATYVFINNKTASRQKMGDFGCNIRLVSYRTFKRITVEGQTHFINNHHKTHYRTGDMGVYCEHHHLMMTDVHDVLLGESRDANIVPRIRDYQVSEASWLESRESYSSYLSYELRKKIEDGESLGKCRLSQEALTSRPDDGQTSTFYRRAGDVLLRYKCARVAVDLRTTETCFEHIPVHHGKDNLFIHSESRILMSVAMEARCSPILPILRTTNGGYVQQYSGGFRKVEPSLITQETTIPDEIVEESGINDASEKGYYSIVELMEGQKELQRGSLESEKRTEIHNEWSQSRVSPGSDRSYMAMISGRVLTVVAARWENMSLELTQIGAVGGLAFLLGMAIYALYNISHVYTTMRDWVEWSRKVAFRAPEVKCRSHAVEMDDRELEGMSQEEKYRDDRMRATPPRRVINVDKLTATILIIALLTPALCERNVVISVTGQGESGSFKDEILTIYVFQESGYQPLSPSSNSTSPPTSPESEARHLEEVNPEYKDLRIKCRVKEQEIEVVKSGLAGRERAEKEKREEEKRERTTTVKTLSSDSESAEEKHGHKIFLDRSDKDERKRRFTPKRKERVSTPFSPPVEPSATGPMESAASPNPVRKERRKAVTAPLLTRTEGSSNREARQIPRSPAIEISEQPRARLLLNDTVIVDGNDARNAKVSDEIAFEIIPDRREGTLREGLVPFRDGTRRGIAIRSRNFKTDDEPGLVSQAMVSIRRWIDSLRQLTAMDNVTVVESTGETARGTQVVNVSNNNFRVKWHKEGAEKVKFYAIAGIPSGKYMIGIHPNIMVKGSASPAALARTALARKRRSKATSTPSREEVTIDEESMIASESVLAGSSASAEAAGSQRGGQQGGKLYETILIDRLCEGRTEFPEHSRFKETEDSYPVCVEVRMKAVLKNVEKKYANQVHKDQVESFDEETLRRELAESRHSHARAGHVYRVFALIGGCTNWSGSQTKEVLENTVQFHTRRIFFIERRLREIEVDREATDADRRTEEELEAKRPRYYCGKYAGGNDARKRGGGSGDFGGIGKRVGKGRFTKFVSR